MAVRRFPLKRSRAATRQRFNLGIARQPAPTPRLVCFVAHCRVVIINPLDAIYAFAIHFRCVSHNAQNNGCAGSSRHSLHARLALKDA